MLLVRDDQQDMDGAYFTLASLPDYLRLPFALLFNTSNTRLSSAFLSLSISDPASHHQNESYFNSQVRGTTK